MTSQTTTVLLRRIATADRAKPKARLAAIDQLAAMNNDYVTRATQHLADPDRPTSNNATRILGRLLRSLRQSKMARQIIQTQVDARLLFLRTGESLDGSIWKPGAVTEPTVTPSVPDEDAEIVARLKAYFASVKKKAEGAA